MTQKRKNSVLTIVAVAIATILAWLSGYFVMQIVYDSIPASIVFGTVWAVIVCCECRFSYVSLKSDGRVEITKMEVKNNLWQIIAAVLVAFLVAAPIELKIFESEILALEEASVNDLALQIQALGELFPSHWIPMVLVCIFIIAIFLMPIFLRMASDDE